MAAIRTFTVPIPQTPFAAALLENVTIDFKTRQIRGFVSMLDAQGNALKSDPFSVDFTALPGPVLTTGVSFVTSILDAVAPQAGTDSVT